MAARNWSLHERIAAVSAAGAILLGLLALTGWGFGLPVLTQVSPAYRAIAPSAAGALLVLGAILLWPIMGRPGRSARAALGVVAGLIALYGLLDLIGFFLRADLNREDVLTAHLAKAWSVPLTPMSPTAGALMFLVGAAVVALLARPCEEEEHLRPGSLAGALGAVATGGALVFVLSYVHGVPLLYGSNALPIAATSALGFLLLGVAVVAVAGPACWPLRPLSGDSVRARLLRTVVPLTVLAVLVSMVAHEEVPVFVGVNRALQSSFLAVVFAALAALVASRVAATVGGALDAAQAAQREAQEALRRSEQRWATTLASIGDAVIATDIAGRITFMNPTAESATGWTLPEAAARPVTEVFHIINEDARQEVECPVTRVLAEGVVVGLANHTLLVKRDGTEVPIDDSGAPIVDEMGRVTGVVLVFHDITARKQAEKALRESQESLTAELGAMQALHGFVVELAQEGDLHALLERTLEAALAIARAEMGNVQLWDAASDALRIVAHRGFEQPFRDFFATVDEGPAACREAFGQCQRVIVDDVAHSTLFAGTPAREVLLEAGVRAVQSTPLVSPTGQLLGVFSTHWRRPHRPEDRVLRALDVLARLAAGLIEQQQAKEALRESEARYRSLFENMLDGFAYCRMLYQDGVPQDFVYLDVNAAFEKLTGLKDVVGKRISEVIPGVREANPEMFEIYGRVARSGRPERFEVYLEPLGLWLSVSVYSPAEEHFVAVFDNITARKQAEESLRESQSDLNRAQAVAHTGSWRLDVRRNDLSWSEEVYRMFGLPSGTSLTYEAFLGRVHPEDREYVDQRWTAALRGEPYDIEHRILVDGAVKWVREKAELEFDSEGTLLGGFGTVQDVTERKQAEQEHEHLHREVLAAEQARTAMAEHLSDEIAHRVKNNLAMVSGLLHMQMLSEPNPEAAEAVRDAIARIRTFVTLHEQMYAAHAEQADLLVALQQVGATISELFAERGDVAVSVRGEPIRCSARVATNLSVIANELITNALKHGGPGADGRRTVAVSLHRTGEDVALTVWNSGAPVPEGLDPAASRTMGLRLVHDIVVGQYQGRFQVRPSNGGSLAEVVVPGEAIRADSLPR